MGEERKPLLVGRGLVVLKDFCCATGLSAEVVTSLVRQEVLEGGLLFDDGRVAGLFDDVLSSLQQLEDLGLEVKSTYNPGSIRTVQGSPDHPTT